ncbi:MerR family DNA-binding transcriptional regulator [Acidobacteria bacterium AH-259-D05]|nr:MerR family DNA-binding transcriptional regulator [Acidobacteria bacterium AH-259-D05]
MSLDKQIKGIEIIEVPQRFYFKISAAAQYTGLSKNTLRKYTDLGLIRAKILPGGDRIYCKEWLEEFIENLPDAVNKEDCNELHNFVR